MGKLTHSRAPLLQRPLQDFLRFHVREQLVLVHEVGWLQLAFAEEFFRLILPVPGIGVIAFAQRQEGPGFRRLA